MSIIFLQKNKMTLLLLLLPLITLVVAEALQQNFIQNPLILFLNYTIYATIYWSVYCIFNSAKTLPISTFFILLFAVANHYVIIFRNASLQPWDITAVSTAISVLPAMKLSVDWSVITAIVYFLFTLIISFFISAKSKRRTALFLLICGAAILSVWLSLFSNDNRDNFWDTVSASRKNGFLLTFITNLQIMHNPPPSDYNLSALSETVRTNNASDQSEATADIIVIMNEAFSDPIQQYGIECNKDPLDFIHNFKDAAKGNLVVSVFGGGTCNTEYDFLTGNCSYMLRNGSYPMQQFVTSESPSIASILKASGYNTTAIHPYYKNGWNRNRAYPLLGFDKFISIDDFENPEIVRQFVSDKCAYKKIFEVTDNSQSPQFVFCVTMQNHLGYDISYENFDEKITFSSDDIFPQAKQYLSLLDLTDDAFEHLINHYKNSDKPTYILFFGDHQPALENSFYDKYSSHNVFEKYTVPYLLWYNKGAVDLNKPLISTNYLSSVLLKTAGLKTTPYNDFLLELMEDIPVICSNGILTKENMHYDISGEHPYSKEIKKYKNLQYNQVFDTKNTIRKIFNP